jgi:hypothetical protein
VLAKLAVETYGDECEVVHCDTLATEDPDNARFFVDVERWIGRPITRIRSEKYASIDEVFEKRRYMAGIHGAICTVEMKKIPRLAYQRIDDVHLFGYTAEEEHRAERFEQEKENRNLRTEWLLIDRWITKSACLVALDAAGIRRPASYDKGFEHANCQGCVKATSPAYWNLVREHYPETFERRARQSRAIGARLVRIRNVRRFLDELPPNDQTNEHEQIDCGPACQIPLDFGDAA